MTKQVLIASISHIKAVSILGSVYLSRLIFVRMGTPSQKRFNRGEWRTASRL